MGGMGTWKKEPWMALAFGAAAVVLAFRLWKITQPTATKADTKQSQDEDEEYGLNNMSAEDRAYHERFMREAIAMADLALHSDETPVGCVFVKDGEIIGRGMNETNRTLNGTRHAEFVAIAGMLAERPISILKETDLYVTVEPCVMCASMLRQYGIRAVYFGCWNERFGGTGGVLNIHSDPSVDPPYPVTGGIFREEAIMLLRKFYVQENEKAPEPKQKKTRELKTEILPMDVHQPKSTPPPALPKIAVATPALGIPSAATPPATAIPNAATPPPTGIPSAATAVLA